MRKTVIFLSLFFISCPLLTLGGKALSSDSSPPRFLEASVPDEESVRLTFDKKCAVVENRLMIGELSVSEIQTSEDGIITVKTAPQIPGKEYVVDITVTDGAGNTTTLLWAFYGFNSRLPTIQLNEISVNASGNNHADAVELLCLSNGNLAGMCLYEGSPADFDTLFVFPNVEVKKGEMILVHYKPEGLPEEVQELNALDESGGKNSHPNARDFWVEGGDGLTGTNGALTLYNTPGGRLIEAFLYSNRTTASDTAYNGFGSDSFLINVTEITEAGGWNWPLGQPRPEDCVHSKGITSTRTVNRRPDSPPGTKESWFIGATGTASLGETNTTEEYSPS